MAPSQSNIRNGFITHKSSKSGRNNNYNYSIKKNHNNNSLVMFNASHYLSDHPVEVVGRIRENPNQTENPAFELVEGPTNSKETSVRVKTESGYKGFSLDGISMAERENLASFYKTYIEDRVCGIRSGGKCTIIMYGPTGTGKSHTMFGNGKDPGIVYRALYCILDGEGIEGGLIRQRLRVKVSVVEIYNEEVFDLISPGAANIGWFKNGGCRAKLELIGKKVKNATSIYGSEAKKVTKEVSQVEKKRIVKSTLTNERSSRSHCLIIIDVPEVGGRLVLVDMAGSENIDQAGPVGSEAKMQTGKINQGNSALKRVVESIANGDSHVPYRDSKLTMLLQDSFEDDGAKILMVLCASSDPRDLHKTIGTLEYGAKAKCIVRLPNSPPLKNKTKTVGLDSLMLQTRILAMDEYILKLQAENKLKEQERKTVKRKLEQKEGEVAQLRMKIEEMERMEEVEEAQKQLKSDENIRLLRAEFKLKIEEYECKANEFMELEYMRMEKYLLQHQQEVGRLRRRLEEIESEVQNLRNNPLIISQEDGTENASEQIKIIPETCLVRANGEASTMSMALEAVHCYDMSLRSEIQSHNTMNYNISADRCQLNELHRLNSNNENTSSELLTSQISAVNDCKADEDEEGILKCARFMRKGWLPTVYEEEENADEEDKCISDEGITPKESKRNHAILGNGNSECNFHEKLKNLESLERYVTDERRARIENIFLLCGNYREIARKKASKKKNESNQTAEPVPDDVKKAVGVQALSTSPRSVHNGGPILSQKSIRSIGLDHSTMVSPSSRLTSAHLVTLSPSTTPRDLICPKWSVYGDKSSGSCESTSEEEIKEMIKTGTSYGPSSFSPLTKIKSIISGSCQVKSSIAPNDCTDDEDKIQSQHLRTCDVYVKWEFSSNETPAMLIGIMKISKDAFLNDLRKMIELDVKQDFIFLTLQDSSGGPVLKENESRLQVTFLPLLPNQESGRLATLRLSTQQSMLLSDSCCSGSPSLGLPASDLVQCSSCSPWLSGALNSISRCNPSTTSAKSSPNGDSPSHNEKMQIVRTVHIRYFSQ